MTRINCLSPKVLSDSWLLAEYRELPRVSKLAKVCNQPSEYVMGEGHVKFFYDKGLYLQKRFNEIVTELENREFNLSYADYREHPEGLNNDWVPSLNDFETNITRLLEKFDEGQRHKFYGQIMTKEDFITSLIFIGFKV